VACSCCTPGRCPITPTTVTPCGTSLTAPRHSPAARSSGPMLTRDTAATTRKIPAASSSPARSAASSVYQARVAPPLRHRAHHRRLKAEDHLGRSYLKGRRRRRQRRPLSCVPQPPPHPRLAQTILVPVPVPAMGHARLSAPLNWPSSRTTNMHVTNQRIMTCVL
jgi:hypothetical protein